MIPEEILNEFNKKLEESGCIFRLYQCDERFYGIEPVDRTFLSSYILNPSKEFRVFIEEFFKNRGIELSHNNTYTTFWCS